MPERPQFRNLEKELLRGSIAPEFVSRTLTELGDHFEDLYEEALEQGLSADAAARQATALLGRTADIAGVVLSHSELQLWSVRHPVVAACGRSLAHAAAAPTVPVMYCYNHGSDILRWGASAGMAVLVTAGLLLGLESLVP